MFQGYSVALTKKMDGFRTGAQREADMTFGKGENPRMEKSQQLPRVTGGGGFDHKGQQERMFYGLRDLFCVLIMVVVLFLYTFVKITTLHTVSEFYCMSFQK